MTDLNRPVEYLIIQCGYVERLIPKMAVIARESFDAIPLCLYGSRGVIRDFGPEYDKDILKHATSHKSSLLIKLDDGRLNDALNFTTELMIHKHCAMFNWFTLYELILIEEGDKTICVMTFDTESG